MSQTWAWRKNHWFVWWTSAKFYWSPFIHICILSIFDDLQKHPVCHIWLIWCLIANCILTHVMSMPRGYRRSSSSSSISSSGCSTSVQFNVHLLDWSTGFCLTWGASSVRVALGWRMSMPLRLDLAAETTPLNHHLFIVCLLLLLSVNLLVWCILHLEIPRSLMCVLIVSILYPDLDEWVLANMYSLDEEMFNTHNNVQPIPTLHL